MSGARGWVLLLLALAACAVPSGAAAPEGDWNDVRALFAVGRFGEARALTATLAAAEPEALPALYWSYRLAESPARAERLRRELLAAEDLGSEARDLLRADAAWSAFGATDYETAHDWLEEVPAGDDESAATASYLGGLAWRARGDATRCRDALAAVPPGNPDYDWARYRLSRLAHADGDAALSRRYLEMAGRDEDTPCRAELLMMEWMLAGESDAQAATRLGRELAHRFPRSLPAALVAEQAERQAVLQRSLSAPAPAEDPDEAVEPATPPPGRYTLQFAAFADRARALQFLDDWRRRLPGLHIHETIDDRGLKLYKLRAGSYPGMSQARDEADALHADHGIQAIPVKAADSP